MGTLLRQSDQVSIAIPAVSLSLVRPVLLHEHRRETPDSGSVSDDRRELLRRGTLRLVLQQYGAEVNRDDVEEFLAQTGGGLVTIIEDNGTEHTDFQIGTQSLARRVSASTVLTLQVMEQRSVTSTTAGVINAPRPRADLADGLSEDPGARDQATEEAEGTLLKRGFEAAREGYNAYFGSGS